MLMVKKIKLISTRESGESCSHIVLLEVSVVVDMASVGVSSHQGRAYGAQPEPHQLLHQVKQLAFCPAHLVPSIEPSPDKMLQVGGGGLCEWS